MKLKIFKGKSVFTFHITLEDGYILKFQDSNVVFSTPVKTCANLWFKVNVLEYLIIQCDKKVIEWKAKDDDNTQILRAFKNDSNNVKCPELVSFFTELDEILKSIKKGNIVDSNKIQLLITLKTHVLQIIFLYPKHIPLITTEFEKQKISIIKVEENIYLKHDLMVESRDKIKKWLKEFLNGKDVNNQPLQLLQTLSEKADDIISELFIELNQKQEELFNSTELKKKDIQFYQKIRDELISDIQQWLEMRIHSWTAYKNSKNGKSVQFNYNYKDFQNLSRDYDKSLKMYNEIKRALSKTKIIEDVMKCFLRELDNVNESRDRHLLIHINTTDLKDIGLCEKLYEEIGSMLSNKSSPMRKIMREFVPLFKQECARIECDFSLWENKLKPNTIEENVPTLNYISNNSSKINVKDHKSGNILVKMSNSHHVISPQYLENPSKFDSIHSGEINNFLKRQQPWSLPIMMNAESKSSKETIGEIKKRVIDQLEKSSLFYSLPNKDMNNERKYYSLTINSNGNQKMLVENENERRKESQIKSNSSERSQNFEKTLPIIVDDELEIIDKSFSKKINCNFLNYTDSDDKSQTLNENSKYNDVMKIKTQGLVDKTKIDKLHSKENTTVNFDNFQLLQDLIKMLSNHINKMYWEFQKYTSMDLTIIGDIFFNEYYESQICPPIYKNIVSLYTKIFKNVYKKMEKSFKNESTGIDFFSIYKDFCTDSKHNHAESNDRKSSLCSSFETYFASTYEELEAVTNSHSLSNALKLLTNAIQTLCTQIYEKIKKTVGADELIPILELIIFHMSSNMYCSLFISIKVLDDFLKPILSINEGQYHGSTWDLSTFVGLFDMQIKNSLNKNE